MARIRSLKPEFFTSEQIVMVSIPARMLFQGLWVFGDDDGYIADSALQLKMRIFPADSIDVNELLDELIEVGLVERIETDQGNALRVPSFLNHQSPRFPTSTKYTVNGQSLTKHYRNDAVKLPKRYGKAHDGEERRGEELSNTSSPQAATETHFKRAWAHWPKKVERKKSLEKFKQKAKQRGVEELIADIEKFGKAYEATTDKQFVPALNVWLNGERWDDELPTATKSNIVPLTDSWAGVKKI